MEVAVISVIICSTTTAKQHFYKAWKMVHILHTRWTARCLSRPQSALLSHGVGPPVVAILAGGPGRGD